MNIIDTIKKLHNLATRNSSIEEAAAAAAKVQELCFKHELDLAEIIASGTDTSVKAEAYEKFDYLMPNTSWFDVMWKRSLLDTLAKVNFCKAVHYPNTMRMGVCGQKHNFEILCYMHEYLSREIFRLAVEAAAEQGFLNKTQRNNYMTGFCEGACRSVQRALTDMFAFRTRASGESTALVVVKGNELSAAVQKVWPRLRSSKRTIRGSRDAFSHGVEAGKGININPGIGASASRTRIG